MKDPDFTGERFIPGMGGMQIAYEHMHRYLFALRWARRKSVLDIASGSGYGAALLAAAAEKVWAMDLDREVFLHARGEYSGENLHFLCADAARIPLPSRSVDLVVAMEVLEHIEHQEDLVKEAARVVKEDGTVLISTPNKAVYSDARTYSNPFHIRELYRDELLELLNAQFPWVKIFHQQMRAGSLMSAEVTSNERCEIFTEPLPHEKRTPSGSMYFMAVCCMGAPALEPPAGSVYLDCTDSLFEEWGQEIGKLNQEIMEFGRWNHELNEKVEDRERTIRDLQRELKEEIARRDEALVQLQSEFDERSKWALKLQDEVTARDERLSHANNELDCVAQHLARIRHALLYRILCRLKLLPE